MAVCFKLLSVAVAYFMASASAKGLPLSIDCGSNKTTHGSNNITWVGDAGFIQAGKVTTVQNSSLFPQPLDTLRYFPTGKKNCYTVFGIPPGSKILVRVTFNYGNYDGLKSPPAFDLQFDSNHWTEVRLDSNGYFLAEMIYVTSVENVSVCVARTKSNNVPFISTLELRPLQLNMYSQLDPLYALLMSTRLAFGSQSLVRYPDDDPYDRLWFPFLPEKGQPVISITSTATSFTKNVPDNAPAVVLRHAITPASDSENFLPLINFLHAPAQPRSCYLNLYFSEVSQSSSRSFFVNLDNGSISGAIVPPYGAGYEFTCPNCTLSSNSILDLEPTKNSSLPPLVNALELYQFSDALVNGTYASDVRALSLLQSSYRQLQAWSGDPCLPIEYNWEWLNCSAEQPPRVTALYLQGMELTGALPDFSALTALQFIDLHNNSLSGPIPDFLGKFPNLKELNLADNDFSGIIPPSLNRPNLNFNVSGNPNLFGPSASPTGTTSNGGDPYWKKGRRARVESWIVVSFLLLFVLH